MIASIRRIFQLKRTGYFIEYQRPGSKTNQVEVQTISGFRLEQQGWISLERRAREREFSQKDHKASIREILHSPWTTVGITSSRGRV